MILGHQKQWKFLQKNALGQKLSHGYLFSGPEKVGKQTIASEWVKSLHCQSSDRKKRPCNTCSSCQMILRGIHPDALFVGPAEQNKGIQIGQIRELIYKLYLKPFLSSYKTVIIDQADSMNAHAQNCFLKTLEEPQGSTVLILVASHPEILFETIRSRVQEIKFHALAKDKIRDFLRTKGLSEKQANEIAILCLGKPGKALEFLENPEKLQEEQKQVMALVKALNSDLGDRFQYANSLSKKPLQAILEVWLIYFREFLLSKTGTQERDTFLLDGLANISLPRIKKIIESLETTNFLISTKNINKRLALEILMMNI